MATRAAITFSIRRCTTDDAATVGALGARLFTETYGPTHPEPELSRYLARTFSTDVMRDAIAADDVAMLLAEDVDGTPIGYSFMRDSPDPPIGVVAERAVEIVRFYVDGTAQGRGVGAALMARSLDEARRRRADTVWLQTWKEATWAVGFYLRMGFQIVGSAPFYFGEQIGDDHVMMIRITNSATRA
jgi:ribosomal protein S18 acetylase RimI-like enzyme